jgi:hypothetical protein
MPAFAGRTLAVTNLLLDERKGDFAPIEKPSAAPSAMRLHLEEAITLVSRIIEHRNQKKIGSMR